MPIERESKRTIEPGDCVFFRECRDTVKSDAVLVKSKGFFFAIMIGVVPPFAKDPPPEYLVRAMGDLGYITFDDLAEFVGEKSAKEVMERFSEKYAGTKEERKRFNEEMKKRRNEALAGQSNEDVVSGVLKDVRETSRLNPMKLVDAHGAQIKKDDPSSETH